MNCELCAPGFHGANPMFDAEQDISGFVNLNGSGTNDGAMAKGV